MSSGRLRYCKLLYISTRIKRQNSMRHRGSTQNAVWQVAHYYGKTVRFDINVISVVLRTGELLRLAFAVGRGRDSGHPLHGHRRGDGLAGELGANLLLEHDSVDGLLGLCEELLHLHDVVLQLRVLVCYPINVQTQCLVLSIGLLEETDVLLDLRLDAVPLH